MTATMFKNPAFAGNGAPRNTTVVNHGTPLGSGLEDDPELYAKVVTRMAQPGATITLDEALVRLDASASH